MSETKWANLEKELLSFQRHDTKFQVIIGSEGGHYDHGDEPYISVQYRLFDPGAGEWVEVFRRWGICIPELIQGTAEWLDGKSLKDIEKIAREKANLPKKEDF